MYARFLRGLFDTDGCLSFRKCYGKYNDFKVKFHHYPSISLTTVSKGLSDDSVLMLKRLGIDCFLQIYSPKKLNERIIYRVIINGADRLNKWMSIIGIKNDVKSSRYLVWKKFGFCPTNISLKQREDLLNERLDPYSIGSVM